MRVVTLYGALSLAAAASICLPACAAKAAEDATGAGGGRSTVASSGCDLNATTSNLASQLAATQPGQTVCLASGSYGTFTGAAKPGPAPVTITAAPGAGVDMPVVFNGASNIAVTGVVLDNATLEGSTHHVTLSYSTVASTGQIAIYPDQMTAASSIVIDHNTLRNQSCGTGLQGRIDVQDAGPNNSNPVGLTISNNYLSGGTADGVRLDAGSGIQVLNNTFTQFLDQNPCHTDTIQIYGSASHVIMKGNFFYNQQNTAGCSLGMWDGGDHNVFENNVVAGSPNNGCYGAVDLLDDNSSTVIHNVFEYGGCLPHGLPGNPCGELTLGGKSGEGAGSGTLIRDNIMTDIANGDGSLNSTFNEDHNMCRPGKGCTGTVGDRGPGTGDMNGVPVFAGGSTPSAFNEFALCPGSPGVGAASDGTNIGLELPTANCSGTGNTGGGGSGTGTGTGSVAIRSFAALAGVKLAAHKIRRGAPVIFLIRLRARARVTITFLRLVVPRAHGRSHRNSYYKPAGTFVFYGRAGLNRLRVFKLHRRKFTAGRYHANVSAGGKSRRVTFTIER